MCVCSGGGANSSCPSCPQGLGLWDQLPWDQAHCKGERKSRRQRRNASGGSQAVSTSRDGPTWIPLPGAAIVPLTPRWAFRHWWAMGHRGELHPTCPGPQALQGLAQREGPHWSQHRDQVQSLGKCRPLGSPVGQERVWG